MHRDGALNTRGQQYEHATQYSPIETRSVGPRRQSDYGASRYDIAPKFVSLQIPDFVLFPPPTKRGTGKKARHLNNTDAVDYVWGHKIATTGTLQTSSNNRAKRHTHRAPGTQHKTPEHTRRGARKHVPAAIDDFGGHRQWNGRLSTKTSSADLPFPPSTPRIPRLPTPDFDDVDQGEESPTSFGFCACCPKEAEDTTRSSWSEGKSKLDKQSRSDPFFGRYYRGGGGGGG